MTKKVLIILGALCFSLTSFADQSEELPYSFTQSFRLTLALNKLVTCEHAHETLDQSFDPINVLINLASTPLVVAMGPIYRDVTIITPILDQMKALAESGASYELENLSAFQQYTKQLSAEGSCKASRQSVLDELRTYVKIQINKEHERLQSK